MIDDILTPAEKEVIKLACKGLDNTEISEKLFVTRSTIATHLYNIYQKMGVCSVNKYGSNHTRIKAVVLYFKEHKELLNEL